MQVGVMISNGGPHPADKWAEQATETLLSLLVDAHPDDASDEAIAARQAKRDLRPALFKALNERFGTVQQAERTTTAEIKTADEAHAHAWGSHDPTPHMDVMKGINEALAKTPWAEHFAKPEVQQILWSIVGQHIVDMMHIERRYHHDRLTGKGT